MNGSGREAISKFGSGWESLPDVREWLGSSPGCSGVVRRPYWIFGSGWEAISDVREWSGCPPVCPGVVGRPSRMLRSV